MKILFFSILFFIAIHSFVLAQQAGDLDLTFSLDGFTAEDYSVGDDRYRSIAVQTDDKILLVCTSADTINGVYRNFVVRLFPDGNHDYDFGYNSDGKVQAGNGQNCSLSCIALQPDGKIVVGGSSDNTFYIARLTTEGKFDSSGFSGDGFLNTYTGAGYSAITDISILPNGKILVTGNADGRVCIAQYQSNGTLDNTFGSNGILYFSTGSGTSYNASKSMAVQPDGNFLLAFDYDINTSNPEMAVVRLLPNGALDTNFGTNGIATVPQYSADYFQRTAEIALGTDGKILILGTCVGGNGGLLLQQLNSDGTKNLDFGNVGYGQAFFSVGTAAALAIQNDGKILVAARSNQGIRLFRRLPNGTADASFGNGGNKLFSVGYALENPTDMVLQSDGKLLLCGHGFATGWDDWAIVMRIIMNQNVGTEQNILDLRSTRLLPNPVVNNTTLEFELKIACDISIDLYYADGRLAKHLMSSVARIAGTCSETLDLAGLPSGQFFISINQGKLIPLVKI